MLYINYGRWNEHIVGPFESEEVANAYIDQCKMNTGPALCNIVPPDAQKLMLARRSLLQTYTVTGVVRGVTITSEIQAESREQAIKEVREAVGWPTSGTWTSN